MQLRLCQSPGGSRCHDERGVGKQPDAHSTCIHHPGKIRDEGFDCVIEFVLGDTVGAESEVGSCRMLIRMCLTREG